MLPYTNGKSFLTGITVEDRMSTDIERFYPPIYSTKLGHGGRPLNYRIIGYWPHIDSDKTRARGIKTSLVHNIDRTYMVRTNLICVVCINLAIFKMLYIMIFYILLVKHKEYCSTLIYKGKDFFDVLCK